MHTTAPMTNILNAAVQKSGNPENRKSRMWLNPSRRLVLRETLRFVGWMLISCVATALVDTLVCWLA